MSTNTNVKKKKKKKVSQRAFVVFVIVMIILDAAFLTAVTHKRDKKTKMSCYDRGLKAIDKIYVNASSDDYRAMYMVPDELLTILDDAVAKNHTELKAVYEVTNLNEMYKYMMYISSVDGDRLDDEARDFYFNLMISSYGNILNGRNSGTMILAATTFLSITDIYDDDNVDKPMVYVYVYKEAYPVVVTFVPCDDDAVKMTATMLINDNLIDAEEEIVKENVSVMLSPAELETIYKGE